MNALLQQNDKSNCDNRVEWIDLAKFFAIIAVLIDHTYGRLYTSDKVAYFSYYSVELFMLIMGITTFWSFSKKDIDFIGNIKTKCWKIFCPYLVASFIYCIVLEHFFDLEVYLDHVIHFNATGPLYYVSLYMQLVLISPIIYRFIIWADKKKTHVLWKLIGLAVVLFLSFLTTNYSNLLSIFGGGGKLFGGTYLVLFYLGMVSGKWCKEIRLKKTTAIIGSVVLVIMTALWWNFISVDQLSLDSKLPFGRGINPTSISFGTYGILWCCTLFFIGNFLTYVKRSHKCWFVLSDIGKHTLYIFLYHVLFLNSIFPHIESYFDLIVGGRWIKRVVCFAMMIFGSIVVELLFKKIYSSFVIKSTAT